MTITDPQLQASVPVEEFSRLAYFYGQQLGPFDLQGEQAYLREKRRLTNRYLHGWGVVCGLEVLAVATDPEAGAAKTALRGPCVQIEPGVALDCRGDEIVLRGPARLDLWRDLSPQDQKRVRSGTDSVWVSICYCERPVDPARPMYADSCGIPADCSYARIREGARLSVTVDRPRRPDDCAGCPGGCPDACVVLARISGLRPGQDLDPDQIDVGVRRMLTRHQLTTVTGISFVHGATYSRDLGTKVLEDGFEVRFSGPVRVDSLTDDVVDVMVHQGGGGLAAGVYVKRGRYVNLPTDEYTDRLVYRQRGGERLEFGDRVIIQVKADFILDRCCRAVDGNHLGGRVPLLPEYPDFAADRPASCSTSPDRPGAWVSGNGTQGGTFESWFLIERRKDSSYE